MREARALRGRTAGERTRAKDRQTDRRVVHRFALVSVPSFIQSAASFFYFLFHLKAPLAIAIAMATLQRVDKLGAKLKLCQSQRHHTQAVRGKKQTRLARSALVCAATLEAEDVKNLEKVSGVCDRWATDKSASGSRRARGLGGRKASSARRRIFLSPATVRQVKAQSKEGCSRVAD